MPIHTPYVAFLPCTRVRRTPQVGPLEHVPHLLQVGPDPSRMSGPPDERQLAACSAEEGLLIHPVEPSHALLGRLLAVSHADEARYVAAANVAGFVYVNELDMRQKRIRYLAPNAAPLPSSILLQGTLRFPHHEIVD